MLSPSPAPPKVPTTSIDFATSAGLSRVVDEHLDLVYSAAFRRLGGDHALAQDVVQNVFLDLVKRARAGRQVPNQAVGAWLHRRAWFAASDVIKSEIRRRQRETKAARLENSPECRHEPDGQALLAEALDKALTDLKERDREVLLWRFYEDCSLKTIGQRAGISEDAAQKRVSRALQRLRSRLRLSGVGLPSTGLAAFLANHWIVPAPQGMASLVTGKLLTSLTSLSNLTTTTITMTAKIKTLAVTAGALGLAVPLVVQTLDKRQLEEELAELKQTRSLMGAHEKELQSLLDNAKESEGDALATSDLASEEAGLGTPATAPKPVEQEREKARRVAAERYAELLDKFKTKLELSPDQEKELADYYETRRPVLEEYLTQSSAGRIDPQYYFVNVGYRPHIPEHLHGILTPEQSETYQTYEHERRINHVESFTNGELSFLQHHLDLTSAQKDLLFGDLSQIYVDESHEDLRGIDTIEAIAQRKDADNESRRQIFAEVLDAQQMSQWEEVAAKYRANLLEKFGGVDLAVGEGSEDAGQRES